MNRALTIAREDVRHALRDRLVWAAVVLFGLIFLPSTTTVASPEVRPVAETLLLLPYDLLTFVLVIVAAVCYDGVAAERTTGTTRYILSLPGTRRDLVIGKLLSRGGIVAIILLVTLAIANVIVAQGYGKLYLGPFWVMATWMMIYAAVWSAIAIGYSAALSSQYRTLGALVVTYVVFSSNYGVWSVVFRPVFSFVFTGSFSPPTYDVLASAPLWLRVTERLNPLVDFWQALRWSVELVGPGTPQGGPLPHLYGTLAFLSFGIIPLILGWRRFEYTDIGTKPSGFLPNVHLCRSITVILEDVLDPHFETELRNRQFRTLTLARADFRHVLKNRVVAGGITVTVLLAGPTIWRRLDPSSISSVSEQLTSIPDTFVLPVLVLSVAVGYRAVVGERNDDTARLILGLPATRRDVLLAKLTSRVMVTILILVSLFLYTEIVIFVRFGHVFPLAFVSWAGSVLAYGIVWTTVVVGISAMASAPYRSLAAVFGLYLALSPNSGLWALLVRPTLAFFITGEFATRDQIRGINGGSLWFRYLDHLNPIVALETLREGLFAVFGMEAESVTWPLFIFSIVTCLLFVAGTLRVSYWRFERSELS